MNHKDFTIYDQVFLTKSDNYEIKKEPFDTLVFRAGQSNEESIRLMASLNNHRRGRIRDIAKKVFELIDSDIKREKQSS
jgi:hypothetical protein